MEESYKKGDSDIDHADELVPGKDGHGKEGFVLIFRQLVEALETGVLEGLGGDCYGLQVLSERRNAVPAK